MKIYLLTASLCLTVGGLAQPLKERAVQHISLPDEMPRIGFGSMDRAAGDPIYQDDFSNAALWDVTADANGNDWEITTTTPTNVSDYMGDMASTTNANGFGTYDGISDLLGASVTPSEAYLTLIAPVNCSAAPFVTLEFEQRYRAFNSDEVILEVSNDGSVWTQWPLNEDEPTNGPTIQETERINITSVAGSQTTVYVRFLWQESGGDPMFGSGYGWMVDDLNIYESWNNDQQLIGNWARAGIGVSFAAGLDYGNWALNQVAEVTYSGTTENVGATTQPNAKLNVTISGAESFGGSSPSADLPPGTIDSMICSTTHTPGSTGTYDVVWWFDSDSSEEVTDNDSAYWTFYVNDYEFGRDDGLVTGGISAVSGSPDGVLTIGNCMDIFASTELCALDIGLTGAADNVDQIIYGECWKWDDGIGEWVFMDITEDHTVTAAENGGIVRLYFPGNISLAPGDLILITAGHYGGSVKPTFALAQATDEQTVRGYSDGSAFFLSDPSAVIVRAIQGDYCMGSILEETNLFFIGQNNPNPFKANSIIQYRLEEAADVSFQIVDLAGRVIMNENFGTVQSGGHQIVLNSEDFTEGTYMYTFTINDKQVTKRMVVSK